MTGPQDDVFEGYMDKPADGKYDAYCVARDMFRLIGYTEGLREAIKMLAEAKGHTDD